jgi:predicted ArsR family transcriptional regulator
MSNNAKTRAAARSALDAYAKATGWTPAQLADRRQRETALSDLLADLHYMADEDGLDYNGAEDSAYAYYNNPEDKLQE